MGSWPGVSVLWRLPWQQDADPATFQPALSLVPEVACDGQMQRRQPLAPCPLLPQSSQVPMQRLLWLRVGPDAEPRQTPSLCVCRVGGVWTCGAARLWGRSREGLGLGGAGRPSSQLVEWPGASVVGTRPTGQGQPTGLGARGGLRCPWATWEATGDLTTSASTDCGRWLGWTAHAWWEESEEGPAPGGEGSWRGRGGEGGPWRTPAARSREGVSPGAMPLLHPFLPGQVRRRVLLHSLPTGNSVGGRRRNP